MILLMKTIPYLKTIIKICQKCSSFPEASFYHLSSNMTATVGIVNIMFINLAEMNSPTLFKTHFMEISGMNIL